MTGFEHLVEEFERLIPANASLSMVELVMNEKKWVKRIVAVSLAYGPDIAQRVVMEVRRRRETKP